MYRAFFGLHDKPFSIVPDPRTLYMSSRHSLALTHLEYGLVEGFGVVLLTGEVGAGKTTLIRHIVGRFESKIEVALIFHTNVSADDLLRLVIKEYRAGVPSQDKAANLSLLQDHLLKRQREGKRCLLIIDEAQNLTREALEEVRLLSNMQHGTGHLLQFVLVGQPELRARIQGADLEQLAQRIISSYHLGPLSRDEIGEYIAYRLIQAGGRQGTFSDEAVELIFEKSGGIPRAINLICEAALIYGFADDAKVITREIVEKTLEEGEGCGLVLHRLGKTPDPSAFNSTSGQEVLTDERIMGLETAIQALSRRVEDQGRQIMNMLQERENGLLQRLESLLNQERTKAGLFLHQIGQIQMQLSQMNGKAQRTQDKGMAQSDTAFPFSADMIQPGVQADTAQAGIAPGNPVQNGGEPLRAQGYFWKRIGKRLKV